jgi:cell division protein FtsN
MLDITLLLFTLLSFLLPDAEAFPLLEARKSKTSAVKKGKKKFPIGAIVGIVIAVIVIVIVVAIILIIIKKRNAKKAREQQAIQGAPQQSY